MNLHLAARTGPGDIGVGYQPPWLASAAWAALVTAGLAWLPWRAAWGGAGAALSVHLSMLGSGLLALAAALYLALDAGQFRAWGVHAGSLALGGAWMLLGASALRAFDATWPGVPLLAPFAWAYEAPSWAAATAVLAALRIDQTWHTRRAGALVLPLAVAALMLDLWLMTSAPSATSPLAELLHAPLGWGWHVGGKLGVAACLVLAAWIVAQARLRRAAPEHWLRGAMVLGFAGFSLALACAAALALMPEPDAAAARRLLAGTAVWVNFGLPFLVWRSGRAGRAMLAWWLGLGLALAGLSYAVALLPDIVP